MSSPQVAALHRKFAAEPNLEFAVLICSRAANTHTLTSDWDSALQWQRDMDWLEQLSRTEPLRHDLANALHLPVAAIDLINAPWASLEMRAAIAENGIALKGKNGLAWQRFLRRSWRKLEDRYWDEIYAH